MTGSLLETPSALTHSACAAGLSARCPRGAPPEAQALRLGGVVEGRGDWPVAASQPTCAPCCGVVRRGQRLDSTGQPADRRVGSHPDQPRSITMNATGPADPTGPHPALMSALTTEHYTLQSSRTSTIAEANGRSMLFLSSGQRCHRRVGVGGAAGPHGRHVRDVRPHRAASAAGARPDQLLEVGRPGGTRRVLRPRHRTHPGVLPDHRTVRCSSTGWCPPATTPTP